MILTSIYLINRLSEKLHSICTQFSLYQCIDEPTHYTEHSSSVIDLWFVSNKDHLIHSGVADAFLNQDLRYHCQIYGIFKFSKKGKRKVQGVPQSQTAALPRPQEEEETDKSKQAQTEQTYEKH